ncbi:MAG: Crp/Fnr family transcriptional regulator [Bacteroidetes bacterium]|nr:Crp/Fnr family transcriptional regulator [Bacteroidota bacterium]MBS1931992.1 Crp/Fnr family transcriptional regulator [Bacteroidota bacterium]
MYELILKNIARFIELTEEERIFFTSLLKLKKLRKKQFLLQEGEIARHEYFINKGCLRTYTIDEKGQEHIIQFAIEDWWTGDMYSFLTQTPAKLNIDAIEDTELFCIENISMEILYRKVPKFERFFRLLLQNAFIANQSRILESMSLSADERYCKFIERYPSMEQRLPLKHIASYLGITAESLSRIRSQYIKSKKTS